MKKLYAFMLLFALLFMMTVMATPVINPEGIYLPQNEQTGTAYTLLITDKSGTEISMNNAAGNVLTIPANATAAIPVGASYKVQQLGAGLTTITAAAGVTFNGSVAASVASSVRYGSIQIKKTAINTWTAAVFTAEGDMTIAAYDPAGIAEQLVGLTATQVVTNKTATSLVLNVGVSGTAVLDEDNLVTDSDTQLATQQSIKAYADTKAPIASPTFTGTVNIPTPFSINSVSMTSTAAELNLLDTAVAGTSVASKALIVGADKEVDTLVIADGGLFLGAGAGTSVSSTAAELNILDGVTVTAAILNLTLTGSANTRSAVRADGGDAAALATLYKSTAGKLYFKVANATADADWELVTTTAAD
jgi:hypothetical protein